MRVQTEEWRRFIPGRRMYQGKKTLFYNGEILYDDESNEYLIYDEEEQKSWQVIIILPGVEVIPRDAFMSCVRIEAVIMSDTVRRVEIEAFYYCMSLSYVKLSRNLEYIANAAFIGCKSLKAIFVPPSCRDIGDYAFAVCEKLIIFQVPHQHTQLGRNVIIETALIEASPFTTDRYGRYSNHDEVNEWIKTNHENNEFSLHRACASFNPLDEVILDIIKRQGLKAFRRPDSVGVTASRYLSENPFAEVKEQKIIKRYILDMMGEVI